MSGEEEGRRVLHALGKFGAPSETFLIDRIAELDRLGWEAWVCTPSVLSGEFFSFPPEERVLLARRREFHHLRARKLLRLERGIDLRSWWLERPIAKVRPALIHAHFGWAGLQALPAALRHRLPLVVGFHGYDALVYPHFRFKPERSDTIPTDATVYSELFARATRILAVSSFLERKLRELGCEREITVIPSGTRLECFPYRGPRSDYADYRLLFIGRLLPYKALDVLLRSLAIMLQTASETRLEVVGDGPERERSEDLARELGVGGRVTFHGELSRSGVREALERSDVLVAPSRTMPTGQAEALSNVVKEALAVGLPVAATRNGGIPEAVPPRYRHELVREGDPEALADRILALSAERARWNERTAEGRRWVESEFDWKRVGRRLASVYEEALTAVS
jgi:colanic acid/amylovoran biosynthesis glycosyltransferase